VSTLALAGPGMGAAGCGGCFGEHEEPKFAKGGQNDLSEGPVQRRGCTDILCIPLFVAAQFVFVAVTLMGLSEGNPVRLYKPRDFRGAYCGVETNWNDGPDLAAAPKLSYTMNLTSMVDDIMKQTICSSVAAEAMKSILPDAASKEAYDCDCCHIPCEKCDGALDTGEAFSDASDLASTISGRMAELTDPSKAHELFSPEGLNGDAFSTDTFWGSATKYFNTVCLPQCMVPSANSTDSRTYTYSPPPDSDYAIHWKTLLSAPESDPSVSKIRAVMADAFTFVALPFSVCPYNAAMCVPVPGLELKDLGASTDYCSFGMANEVKDALGHAAAGVFETLGVASFKSAASESFGKWVGDFQASIDTFILVALISFAMGLIFLVLLRFFIGCCVWLSILFTIVMFFAGGFFFYVLSGQCEGAGLLDSGRQTAVAIAVAGQTVVTDVVQRREGEAESLTGRGEDYRGRQSYTRSGKRCLMWDTQKVMPEYSSQNYEALVSARNFCRNPYNATDLHKAKTIWCITPDPGVPWEECTPIGIVQPECVHGYEITGQHMRDALRYSSYVVWALGGLWLLVILCFINRIRLAIALNKVAAVFVAAHPTVLLVPVFQAIVAILWCTLWFYGASFLLSQVPDNYTPKGAYATYAEAYGTESPCSTFEYGDHCTAIPGACIDKWPSGGVWRDPDCDIQGNTTKCWRCSQPRYTMDWRFGVSFFVFLWNNAFNVALGQTLIAMAVGLWFFSANKSGMPVVLRAVRTVLRYHIGTVAFGSFIVALVEFIRYLMKYFEKQAQMRKNRCVVVLLKAVQCCLWCFEKCLKFLNKNAYIQTALMGTNFCTSARNAFALILRNVLRFGTVAVLGNAIRMIGFLCIMSSTGVVGYILMREMHPDISPFMPVLLFLMMAYVVSKLYMNVFGLAVDTCLQCFLAVEEMGLCSECVPGCLKNFASSVGRKSSETPRSSG